MQDYDSCRHAPSSLFYYGFDLWPNFDSMYYYTCSAIAIEYFVLFILIATVPMHATLKPDAVFFLPFEQHPTCYRRSSSSIGIIFHSFYLVKVLLVAFLIRQWAVEILRNEPEPFVIVIIDSFIAAHWRDKSVPTSIHQERRPVQE
jgi:hypothetical protein